MILLRPMRDDEYLAYLDYFIPDYTAEITANYALSPSDALAQAQREIAADLPDGVNTRGQILLCLFTDIEDVETQIGYLWYKPDDAMRSAFIYDFYIFPALQGQGLGKQAMVAFEKELKSKGISQIKLRVAGDNQRARHVYEATGFRVTGINMSKNIPVD
ncbi:putative N-acetyltransferase YycN [Klebsiella spallanzanii]|uniref:N-acetyltransferase YycN n=1 Tax=Klebsiella spallanzanii TaxID=2587528 RepID=A0A564HL87_9ENTR|nr:GNAT family N-acetyltransferase [Klebsiella spallanzanii]MDM4206503.1 GNAT family N-acetyltransferase [Klebsiella spallanzanii]VUS32628.1 putative N-acetyltransferase YycN [Klebsiella spallanzanii]VUS63813.1 putative N-acetyltransferase YycN [Klebsiella spallanzanii]